MTIIHVSAKTSFPSLIADCALSQKGFFLHPLKLPMNGNRKSRAAFFGSAVKMMQQKAVEINSNIVAAYAGDTTAARTYLKYLKANSDSLTDLSRLKDFFLEIPPHPMVSDVLHREFVIVGLYVNGPTQRAFKFAFPDGVWLEDNEITVGSGAEIVERILTNSQTKVLNPSDQFRDAEKEFQSLVAYLLGHEGFTSEPYQEKFGGAYTGFIHDGSRFCKSAPWVAMHWGASVSKEGKIEQQAQPVILDSQWIDDWMLVRRVHAHGGRRSTDFTQDEWLIPPLMSDFGYPDEEAFDALLIECLQKDFFSTDFLLVSEISCSGKAIQMSAHHTLRGDADDAVSLIKSGDRHEFKVRNEVLKRNIDLALKGLRQKAGI
jgi:hypothetical protein